MFPIEINNITKFFGDRLIIDQVSFEVKNNEIFGFVGLNGIGKTTLIKIILNLLDQDGGQVNLFGVNNLLPASRSEIAYLPEKFHPSSYLKGLEFIEFVLGFYKKKLDKKKLVVLAKDLDLDPEALNFRVAKYSKGMTQKLGLMATFLSDVKLTILDEPMSGLDPRARICLKKELINYKSSGNTVFFSSHILSDIDEICDRIAVLNRGKIVFLGTPSAFKAKHQELDLEKTFLKEIGLV